MKAKFTLASLLFSSLAFGQVVTPKASPLCKIQQTVGLTTIEIEYHRPSKNDRVIFGDLIKFDNLWRTGANENTTISLSDILIFDKDTLQPGKYALYTKPNKDSWTIYFYKELGSWGTPEKWEVKNVAVELTKSVKVIESVVETFTIELNNLTNNSGEINLKWDKTSVAIPFTLNTSDKVVESIKKVMDGPSSRDYYSAGNYYFSEEKDLDQAIEWLKKAVELEGEKAFWMYRKLALVQAKTGDYKSAILSAQTSVEGAAKVGNVNYVEMNNASIKDWKVLLNK